jgi:hypothetical protein
VGGWDRVPICQQCCDDGLIDRFKIPPAGDGTGKIDIHY